MPNITQTVKLCSAKNNISLSKKKPFKIFIDGQQGTTGLTLFNRLVRRKDINILNIDDINRKNSSSRKALINFSDLTFLCLPDEASKKAIELVNNNHTCIIDTSTSFRTSQKWTYGLPELSFNQREQICKSKRIAIPGCHATAFILSVRPLIEAKIISPEYQVSACSLTGYSGGGKKMITAYEEGKMQILSSPCPYSLNLSHKHLPEMQYYCNLLRKPIFTPIVGNFLRGLAIIIYWNIDAFVKKISLNIIHKCYSEFYKNEKFIRVQQLNNNNNAFFNVQGSNNTNYVDLFVFGNNSEIITIARLDNLGKGSSGAAIQCMNLYLGINEDNSLN